MGGVCSTITVQLWAPPQHYSRAVTAPTSVACGHGCSRWCWSCWNKSECSVMNGRTCFGEPLLTTASLVSRGLAIFAVRDWSYQFLSQLASTNHLSCFLSPGLREVHRTAAAIVQHVQWPGEGGIWRPSSIPDCQRQGMDHVVMNLHVLTCGPI